MLNKKVILLSVSLAMVACQKAPVAEDTREPLIEVEGQYLYADDVAAVIPESTSPEDSAALADAYIRKWATNVLLYDNAQRNVPNESEIENMVEEYRKSLIIHYYQQRLVAERLGEANDDAVLAYYNEHQAQFPLQENLLRGLFLKVPNNAPKIESMRKAMKNVTDEKNIQTIEDYSVKYAATYDYFVDNWVYLKDLTAKLPREIGDPKDFLANHTLFETSDSTYTYLLRITEYKLEGSTAPVEFVNEKIRSILNNQSRIDYIKQFEMSLYDDAVENGKVTFYKPLVGNKTLESDKENDNAN